MQIQACIAAWNLEYLLQGHGHVRRTVDDKRSVLVGWQDCSRPALPVIRHLPGFVLLCMTFQLQKGFLLILALHCAHCQVAILVAVNALEVSANTT